MKYNKSKIMKEAHRLYKEWKQFFPDSWLDFSHFLKLAWWDATCEQMELIASALQDTDYPHFYDIML